MTDGILYCNVEFVVNIYFNLTFCHALCCTDFQ